MLHFAYGAHMHRDVRDAHFHAGRRRGACGRFVGDSFWLK
jgi:hypothetical protein